MDRGLRDADTPYPAGRSYRGWRFPRHLVPGYDRTVPPGHFATGSGWAYPRGVIDRANSANLRVIRD
jgi:hypothetical protein